MKAVIIAIIAVFVVGMVVAAVVATKADPQIIDVDPSTVEQGSGSEVSR